MKTIIPVVVISCTLIIAFLIGSAAYKYKYKAAENISVTGLAEKDFVSDQVLWSGSYTRKMMDLKSAYALLKQDESQIKSYLNGKGISENEMVFSAISIDKEFDTRYGSDGRQVARDFTGYNLRQEVTVDSRDIDKVEKISREVTELIQAGIEFNSSAPSYYYTKLSELKIDLLAKSSADAKMRAETIAKHSGSSLGSLRRANMGVFQITGQNSNEDYSYGGVFNTSSKNKTASITMRMDFSAN